MTDIRQKDPCRFCGERNLPECSGSCQSKSVKRRLDLQLKEVVEENTELKDKLEIAEKMIEIAMKTSCASCKHLDMTCYDCIKQRALAEIKKAGE